MFMTKQQARALGVAIVAAVGFSGCATYADEFAAIDSRLDTIEARVQTAAQNAEAARHAGRTRFERLDAAFQRIQPLVDPLRSLVGGFGVLGRGLHPRLDRVEARVDRRELVGIGGAAGKAHCGDDRDAERAGLLPGHEHACSPLSVGERK